MHYLYLLAVVLVPSLVVLTVAVAPSYLPHISSLVVLTVAVALFCLDHACFLDVLAVAVLPCISALVSITVAVAPRVSSLVVPSVPVAVVVVHIFVQVVFQQIPIEDEVVIEDIHLADVFVRGDEGITDHTHENTPPPHRCLSRSPSSPSQSHPSLLHRTLSPSTLPLVL